MMIGLNNNIKIVFVNYNSKLRGVVRIQPHLLVQVGTYFAPRANQTNLSFKDSLTIDEHSEVRCYKIRNVEIAMIAQSMIPL